MGIPAFFGIYINELNNKSEKKFLITRQDVQQSNVDIDILNIDMNSMLHGALQYAFGYGSGLDMREELLNLSDGMLKRRFEEQIRSEIQTLYDVYKPSVIYISVDGGPPLPKLKQQRERRYRSLIESEVDKFPFSAQGITGFLLTPGSWLMEWITINLPEIIESIGLEGVDIYIDGSNNIGEGEQKFMNTHHGREMARDAITVVNGADADLILMMLTRGIGYIDRGIEDMVVIDIEALFDVISERFPIFDFIFMVMLLGNDFVPPLPMMEDVRRNFEKALNVYDEIRKEKPDFRLVVTGELNDFDLDPDGTRGIVNKGIQENILYFFKQLSRYERSAMATLSRTILKTDHLLVDNLHQLNRIWYGRILSAPNPPGKTPLKEIRKVNNDYIRALMWTFRYLAVGQFINTDEGDYNILDMSFTYPYEYAPLASGLTMNDDSVDLYDPMLFQYDDMKEGEDILDETIEITNPFTSTILSFPETLGRNRVVSPIFTWIYDLKSVDKWRDQLFPETVIEDTMTVFRDYTSKIFIPKIPIDFINEFQDEFEREIQKKPDSLAYYNNLYKSGILKI